MRSPVHPMQTIPASLVTAPPAPNMQLESRLISPRAAAYLMLPFTEFPWTTTMKRLHTAASRVDPTNLVRTSALCIAIYTGLGVLYNLSNPTAVFRHLGSVAIAVTAACAFGPPIVHMCAYPVPPNIKAAFRSFSLVTSPSRAATHSHPVACHNRDVADTSINQFVCDQGLSVFSVQASKPDVMRGIRGSLRHLWPCDRHSPEFNDVVRDHDVLKFMNVDYYVDWNDYLFLFVPMILYTFDPDDPAGSYDDYNWTVNASNEIVMTVGGGAQYCHQLWDYNVDHFTATAPGMQMFFQCERIPLQGGYWVVLIQPIRVEPCVTRRYSHTLKRQALLQRGITSRATRTTLAVKTTKTSINMCLPAASTAVHCPLVCLDHYIARCASREMTIHDANQITPHYVKDASEAFRLAIFLFNHVPQEMSVRPHFSSADEAMAYAALPAYVETDQPDKFTARKIAPAVFGTPVAPTVSLANERWCIMKRVVEIHNPYPIPS